MIILKILQIICICLSCFFMLFNAANALPAKCPENKLKNTPAEQIIKRISKAAEMRNYMNETADPCKDFYKFACGNWARINPANSEDSITTGFFEIISKALTRRVSCMLKSGKQAYDTPADLKVKDFYESCIKIKHLKGDYKNKLLKIINEFGEMPAMLQEQKKQWNETKFDWLETVAKISHKYGIDIIIGLDILPDYVNNTVNRIYIGHPDFALETRSMYTDDFTEVYRDSYQSKIMSDLTKYFGLKEILAKQTAKEIIEFEVELAFSMFDETMGLDMSEMSLPTTVAEMQEKYAPTIDIQKLVTIAMGENITELVYEFAKDYQTNLMGIVHRTPKRIIANYIFYMLCSDFIIKIHKKPMKQESTCIDKTKKHFAKNVDNMFYRKYSKNATENDINVVWSELKSTYKSNLLSDKLNWINKETRDSAIEKLDIMKLEINSYADTNFTEEFFDLIINNEDYVENLKSIFEWNTKNGIAEYHEPPKPLEAGELLSYTPANIILENTIKVPVSLLQPYYLWDDFYPTALKFGTIGTLVGHELIHSFDDQGRKYDKDGNNYDWWDDNSTAAFVKRTECFTEQYSKYLYNGRYLPKSISQSENIADNGGMRMAYRAYLKWHDNAIKSKQNLNYETLPDLKYNSKQLFFISYAQVWCNDAHPGIRDLQTSTDQHVPGKFRVIGPLSNFPEFSKEFNCKLGTPMNPVKKCEIY